jgi:hypothetical protein
MKGSGSARQVTDAVSTTSKTEMELLKNQC